MIAIPISGEIIRRTLRTMAVGAIAVASIGFSIQGLLIGHPMSPGVPPFSTSGNIALSANEDAGVAVGDRIDYARMPVDQRYGDASDGLRWPPVGQPVSYVVEHAGKTRIVTLKAEAFYWGGWWSARIVFMEIAYQATFLALVLLASALVLIRPTALTATVFLFAAAGGGTPFIYSALPPSVYAAALVLGDILIGLGDIGYVTLAIYLDQKRGVPSRLVWSAAALLLLVIFLPIAASDVSELMRGIRPAWPIAGWASLSAKVFCFGAGSALFFRLAARTSAPRMLRILAAVLAGVGVLVISIGSLNWVASAQLGSWYVANFPTFAVSRVEMSGGDSVWWLRTTLALLEQLGSLLAFYLIIRARVADTGPVLSRVGAYIVIALLLIVVFILADLGLSPALTNHALLVPFEILAAIAIGYWVSGLRDVAGCLSLASVDSWSAWAKGHGRDEQDALVHSLGLAERTKRPGIIAEVRALAAFSAWRDGKNVEFERSVNALQNVLGGRSMRGIGAFACAASSGDDHLHFAKEDLPEWRARTALILCARTDDAERAQQLAADALASADRSGLPSLQTLASIAVAEICPDQRTSSLERAHAIARDAGWPALSKSILALRANARDIGILQPFVDVRLRKSRSSSAWFDVSLFNAELRQNGAAVPLAEKELELLLSVASARTGTNDNDLIDALWPESEGDAARNAFRVCLHRLRKNVGDARIVTRVGKGYALHPWADVDLWRFASLISNYRESGKREDGAELQGLCDALRAGQGRRATLGDWFFRFEQLLQQKLDEAERLLDPAARGARM
jgi:hypothetical protein